MCGKPSHFTPGYAAHGLFDVVFLFGFEFADFPEDLGKVPQEGWHMAGRHMQREK